MKDQKTLGVADLPGCLIEYVSAIESWINSAEAENTSTYTTYTTRALQISLTNNPRQSIQELPAIDSDNKLALKNEVLKQ